MSERINEIVQQTYQYFYVDGLPELATGAMYLLTGGLLAVILRVQPGPLGVFLTVLGIPAVILGGIYLLNRLLQRYKGRMTYARTGYVSYRRERKDNKRWIVIAVALLLPVVLIFLPKSWRDLPLVVGGILGAVQIYLGYRMGIRRFYGEGAIAILLGVACALIVESEILGVAIIFLGTGIVLMAVGGLTLWRYLQAHPVTGEVTG